MIITKQKILELINETVIITCKACGKNLSLKDQFRIKEKIFKEYEAKNNEKRK